MHRLKRSVRVSFGLLVGVVFGALLGAILGAKGDEMSLIMILSVLWWTAWTALS